ncbi:protein O-GlcNAc transferase [Gammaproteobacteria bacterium]
MESSTTLPSTLRDCLALADKQLFKPHHPRASALAISFYRQAVELAPDRSDVRLSLARAYYLLGQNEEAIATINGTLARHPEAVEARLLRCLYQIPIVYRDAVGVIASRAAYREHLERLVMDLAAANATTLTRLATWSGRMSPSYLPYQGENDVALQRTYGALMGRAMALAYPAWASTPMLPPPAPGEPLRVGFVSGRFRNHVDWHAIIRGWLTALDPDRFAVSGYMLDDQQDECTNEARRYCVRFTVGHRSLSDWCETIRADRPHLLIYPEIGQCWPATRLAMLRLAPVQCVAGGRCVTSGLPTMDYFLGSDAMEPADGDAHYSERLVRLPNLAYIYRRPPLHAVRRDREEFGLRAGAVVYLSPHTLLKYLPQHDDLYPRIAERVGDCQFVFVRHPTTEALTLQFERRIVAAFSARGLDWRRHVRLLPHMEEEDYNDIQALADVYLDAIGWNGGTTTATALGYDLPVVTLAGPVFRGRMGMAMLRHVGVPDTVAATPDDYVTIAIRLGQDEAWRRAMRERIAHGKHRLYDDPSRAAALATFLEEVGRGQTTSTIAPFAANSSAVCD